MEYLLLGYVLIAAAIYYLIKAISCVFKKVMNMKEVIVNGCLMANFTLFGTMFMTIQQKPELANNAKVIIVLLGVVNVIAIVIMAIIMSVKRSKS